MFTKIIPSVLIAGLAPVAANAQSLPGGFEMTGFAEISHADSETYSRADFDIAHRNLLGGFGLALGVDAFRFDGTTLSELYPTLTYSFGENTVSVGKVRSVLDNGYLPERQILGSSFLDVTFGSVDGSAVKQILLVEGEGGAAGVDNIGLRWDGAFGNTQVGVSLNHLDDNSGSLNVFALALRHDIAAVNDLSVFAAFETTSDSSVDNTWRLGVEGEVARVSYGLSAGDAGNTGTGNYVRGWAGYEILDGLEISAEVVSLNDADADLYGAGVSYNIWDNLTAEANYVKTDIGGSDSSSTEFSLRFEF